MEAMAGGARVIVMPSRQNLDDEQKKNVLLFSRHYPIELAEDVTQLDTALLMMKQQIRTLPRPQLKLLTDGVNQVKCTILGDLGN